MIHIEENKIPDELYGLPIILFGAGSTGRVIANLLETNGCKVTYFVDDDEGKQGEIIQDIEVISYDSFRRFCGSSGKVAVVISSIYGKSILERIRDMAQLQIFEMYDWYYNVLGQDTGRTILSSIQGNHEIEEFKTGVDSIKYLWADKESGNVLEGLYNYLVSKDSSYISDVCSLSEHYFIPEVMGVISKPLVVVDAGAYEGELLQAFTRLNIPLEKIYSFEADPDNYQRMALKKEKNALGNRQICINKGLWNEETEIFFLKENEASKIVDFETEHKIETTTLNDYFGTNGFNFLKMDIEGAELNALRGGVDVIKRERPILAVSIYHSLHDFYKIPQYLREHLVEYSYYVRHHALIFCETVLYAIPKELQRGE